MAIGILSASLCACLPSTVYPNAQQPHAISTQYDVLWGVQYVPDDWPELLKADVYVPTSKPSRLAGLSGLSRHPTVVMIHASGWHSLWRLFAMHSSRKLASRGYAVINIDYRKAPQSTYPGPLHDAQQALHWLHQHAEQYGFDTNRIAVMGYSSGGHTAALLGTISAGHPDDQPYGGPKTRVHAVVAGGAPYDLVKYQDWWQAQDYMGGKYAEQSELYQRASPLKLVSADDPPAFLFHGGQDEFIPMRDAFEMRLAYKQQGVPIELCIFRSKTHMDIFYDSLWKAHGAGVQAGMDFLDRTLQHNSPKPCIDGQCNKQPLPAANVGCVRY